jgi:transposase-like protein
MSTGKRRVFTREFKLAAIERVLAGEMAKTICKQLQITPSHLSNWCERYRRHGAEGIRHAGRPMKPLKPTPVANVQDLPAAQQQISELQRKVGQQQVELDFFQQALRHVGEARQSNDGGGVKASTPRSGQ